MLHDQFQAPEPSNSGEKDFYVYFISEPTTLYQRAILDPRATIKTIRQCYMINFKHLSQAILEKKIFTYISCLNPRPYIKGPFWTLGPPSEQIYQRSHRQCYIFNFKHLSQVVQKKKIFFLFFYVFQWFQPGTPWYRGHLGNWGLDLNKLGKRPLGTATCQFSRI